MARTTKRIMVRLANVGRTKPIPEDDPCAPDGEHQLSPSQLIAAHRILFRPCEREEPEMPDTPDELELY